ncbi:MAG: hypothetical protein AAF610_07765 [Pseudomonadota bacterium]
MSDVLAQPVDLVALAARGAEFETRLTVSQLPRLAVAVRNDDRHSLEVSILLSLDGDVVTIRGGIKGELGVACQKCGGDVSTMIDLSIHLVSGELPDGDFDATAQQVVLAELIEDEVLLHIEDGLSHDDDRRCADTLSRYAAEEERPEVRTPFAGLKDLMARSEVSPSGDDDTRQPE